MRIGTNSLILVLAGLLCVSAAASEKAPRSTIAIIERLLTAPEHTPPAYHPDPDAPYPTERQFSFDDLIGLDPATLISGVQYVLVKYGRPEDPAQHEAYMRSTTARLHLLFEYYPLLARTPEDFDRLLGLIDDGTQAPELRVFLLRHSAPGLMERSALGEYMQGMLAGTDVLDGRLTKIIENPTESIPVQEAALDALSASIAAHYAQLLAADPLVRDAVRKGGPAPRIQDVKTDPAATPLARRTQLRIEKKSQDAGRIAELLYVVGRDPNRPLPLRRRAEAVAAVILRDYPIPNEAALRAANRQQPPPQ